MKFLERRVLSGNIEIYECYCGYETTSCDHYEWHIKQCEQCKSDGDYNAEVAEKACDEAWEKK